MELWHDGLTEKQRRFCEAYAGNGGNALAAARSAGYKSPHPEGQRLLQNATISRAIEALRETHTSAAIATREQRQAWWTKIMNDEDQHPTARLKASELLARAQGDFIERREVAQASVVTSIKRIIIDATTPQSDE